MPQRKSVDYCLKIMKFTDVMGENKESDIPAWDGFLMWGDGGGPGYGYPMS